MTGTVDSDQEPDYEPTPADVEMFYHTASMLELSIDVMSKLACPDHDSGILLARAAASMMMSMVFANTTEDEFYEMEARYLGGDDEVPQETHAGTETRQ